METDHPHRLVDGAERHLAGCPDGVAHRDHVARRESEVGGRLLRQHDAGQLTGGDSVSDRRMPDVVRQVHRLQEHVDLGVFRPRDQPSADAQ
jgi:hypothetical protein